ncbi:MAG: transcription elongation factor GreA [Anaerolineae bacterium]|jgi:transcription elongation factor GreA|nr:transcription elongation factor GreA [Anaerolineae bacterium]
MNKDPQYLTKEGIDRLRTELADLTGRAREEISIRLRAAISMGDLSENADYHKAKEDQGFLEGRIQELEYILANAVIIEEMEKDLSKVGIGDTITIQEDGEPSEVYYLVGPKEADPVNGRISHESPIGKALMGRKVGDVVAVTTPSGTLNIKIIKIE